MKAKQKKFKVSKRRIGIIMAFVLLLGLTIYYFAPTLQFYRDGARQANMTSIRELVLMAVHNVKKDAPVDAKTGDVYFPESRLFLPRPDYSLKISYILDSGDIADTNGELSVSTKTVFGSTQLYSARTMNELFETVPKLQACSRGVKIVSQKFDASDDMNELKHTITLNNGQIKYIYIEKLCPEIEQLADILQNIRAY